MSRNPNWTRDELILALDLYLREGMLDNRNEHVLELSQALNQLSRNAKHPDAERFRNPNGVSMKLSNFASIDPNHPGRALYRGGQGDSDVWEEFTSNSEGLAREVARIRRQLAAIEQPLDEENYHTPIPELVEVHEYIAQRAGRKSSGQGYSLDPRTRRAIELHAMNYAIEYYIARGWHVEDVSATMSYDLRCTQPTPNDTDELHVEVKGTTSRGSGVLLTPNEVIHARTYSNVALCIVSEIIVTRDAYQQPIASGGIMRIIYPWDINVGQLSAVGYEYTIPPNDL